MTFLSKGTLTLCLLAVSAAIVSALDLELVTEEETVQPFDLWDSDSATLLGKFNANVCNDIRVRLEAHSMNAQNDAISHSHYLYLCCIYSHLVH